MFDSLLKPKMNVAPTVDYYKNGVLVEDINTNECDFKIYSWLDKINLLVNHKVMYDLDKEETFSEISDNNSYDCISLTGNAKNILTVGAIFGF